jgi:hypothetical protein
MPSEATATSELSSEPSIGALLPILCTIPNAAMMIGRGQTFIYAAIGDGRIEAVKSDKRTLVVVESLREYAKSLPPAKIKPMPPRKQRVA